MRTGRVYIHGIYRITNTITGESYVGKAMDVETRLRQHFRQLADGRHPNPLLQGSYNQHGASAFATEVMERGDSFDALCKREWELIGQLRPAFNLAGPHLPGHRKGKPFPGQSEKMKAYWRLRRAGLAPGFYRPQPSTD